MAFDRKKVETVLPRGQLKSTNLRLNGNIVCLELVCHDAYMARVLFEDLIEREKHGRVYFEIGKRPED